MWKIKDWRTTPEEITELVQSKSFIFVKCNGVRAGQVKITRMDEETGMLGMLVVEPKFRGKKLGSVLMEAAEAWAREEGCKQMRLELLTSIQPVTWANDNKEFLTQWYTRRGYVPSHSIDFPCAELLACECDFKVWLKPLY